MATKRERIATFTDEQLKARQKAGKTKSDWKKAAAHALPDGSDPDDAMEPVDMNWATTELPLPRPKTHASLRLDADMLDWFRAQGRGYQTKINAILRSYYQQHLR
jgi:uncharacterized protein (DUF4415 family)